MPPDIETFSYPHKASAYSYRVPTPPRIVVPPPTLNADALPDITLRALRSSNFLHHVNYNHLVTQNAQLEWTYERRREAQMILPYLYLGPMTAAKDERFLRGEGRVGGGISRGAVEASGTGDGAEGAGGITMLLGIRQKHSFESKLLSRPLQHAQQLGLEAHPVDLSSNADLISNFPRTTALINDHLARTHAATGRLGNVLVFCESGNERSAGVVAAYLMETHADVDYIKAMQLVQAQRFCANFDDAMKRLLQGYWDILCARRQVGQAGGGEAGGGAAVEAKSKRGLWRDDEDEAMDEDDLQRFGGRTFAPFMDQPLE